MKACHPPSRVSTISVKPRLRFTQALHWKDEGDSINHSISDGRIPDSCIPAIWRFLWPDSVLHFKSIQVLRSRGRMKRKSSTSNSASPVATVATKTYGKWPMALIKRCSRLSIISHNLGVAGEDGVESYLLPKSITGFLLHLYFLLVLVNSILVFSLAMTPYLILTAVRVIRLANSNSDSLKDSDRSCTQGCSCSQPAS